MKYIMQFGIIIGLSLIGEVLNAIVPLPVPSSVWGMVLLFVLLCLKVIKLDQIEVTAGFLLSIMSFTFVPVGASLISSFPAIQDEIVGVFAIINISTVICFFITGKVGQKIIDSSNKNKGEE